MARLRVAVLFGGRSGEHAVSIQSARSVVAALDRNRYEVVAVGITREGRWVSGPDPEAVLEAMARGETGHLRSCPLVPEPGHPANPPVDVVFPVLHGPLGEDGTVQGVLELAELPYVGAGVAASAVGMDKALMKAAFRAAGLPQVAYRVVRRWEWASRSGELAQEILGQLGLPLFVKPANLGSSVGVRRVDRAQELDSAVDEAFRYDLKVLVEKSAAPLREIECSVLGNDEPQVSLPGEVVPGREFYDYQAKYHDPGTRLLVPAPLEAPVVRRLQELAAAAFFAVDACGMARVDFFLRPDGQVLVNEINTIPGFTAVSMYPKLWEASGLSYSRLLDRLIELALERHRQRLQLRRAHVEFRPEGGPP